MREAFFLNGVVKTFDGLFVETYISITDHIFAKSLVKQIQHNFLITQTERREIQELQEKVMLELAGKRRNIFIGG